MLEPTSLPPRFRRARDRSQRSDRQATLPLRLVAMAQRSVPHVWRPFPSTRPGLHRLPVDTDMIALAWLGVVIALIALMIAGYRGDILLGILAGVVGCYCWALLWELINAGDWEPWDDD